MPFRERVERWVQVESVLTSPTGGTTGKEEDLEVRIRVVDGTPRVQLSAAGWTRTVDLVDLRAALDRAEQQVGRGP